MYTIPEILFEERVGNNGHIGLITLRRQQALNALNHAMFIALYQQLMEWEASPNIKAVIIRAAEGRAFCAGGDIRYAYLLKVNHDSGIVDFFSDEYRMDRVIYHYKKPYIALLDGITMGGGVGISIFASHRVATERLQFAMPETGIGFYPDVGASFFLPRLAHKIGYYLGLTGVTIPYQDCFALGIVNHVIAEDRQESLIQQLIDSPIPNKEAVTQIIKKFNIDVPASNVMLQKNMIETLFSEQTLDAIIHALKNKNDAWCDETLAHLSVKSPTSLKVTLEALQRGEKQNYDTCMDMELQITTHFLHSHDFFEGIRAILIDKDKNPQWQPKTLADVSDQAIAAYFPLINA